MTPRKESVLLNEQLLTPWLTDDRPLATYLLIVINVIVFVAMCVFTGGTAFLTATSQQILAWGGNWAPLTFNGQEWRLVTSGFEHIGVVHLLMNMYVLWLFGRLTERIFGSMRFLIIYVLSGIGASLFSALSCLLIGPMVSAGSSGSICGVLGAYFSFILLHRSDLEPSSYKSMMRKFGEYALLILVYGIFVRADHAAHLGGVLTGGLLGAALMPRIKGEGLARRHMYAIFATCLTLSGLGLLEASSVLDSAGNFQVYRAALLKSERHKEEAVALLKDVVHQHPENTAAYVELAACEVELNDNKSASEAINTALKLSPENEAAKSTSAFIAFREGDYEKSRQICAKIPRGSPYYKLARGYVIARIDGVNGDLTQALDEAALDNNNVDMTSMVIYLQAGHDVPAAALADKILKKDPRSPEALFVRLTIAWKKRDYKEAMAIAKLLDNSSQPDATLHAYASFLYSIAANMADDSHPNLLLEQNQRDIDKNKWTKAIGEYLTSHISESQLIARAEGRGQQTEAYAYIGLNLLAHHHPAQAKPYLSWDVKNGVSIFDEYTLARYELGRLNSEHK